MENSDTHRPRLTIILPAFNEEGRIVRTLNDAIGLFRDKYAANWELIVVDDGSRDRTAAVVREFAAGCSDSSIPGTVMATFPELVLISHPANLGKGAAVRTGVLASRGELVLYADADNATPFTEYHLLLEALECRADVACGSRFGSEPGQVRRTLSRRIIAAFFATLARLLVNPGVEDTQCGFKLFRRSAALSLFQKSSEKGYLFDLEILGLAALRGIPVAEIPVAWREIPGSRVRLVRDSWKMFFGLFRLRRTLRQQATSLFQSPAAEKATAAEKTEIPQLPLDRTRTGQESSAHSRTATSFPAGATR